MENGLLPASFLPGDSLLLLSGALIAKGVMGFAPTLLILTAAAGLGCWLSYIQGRWLGHTGLVKSWLLQLPAQYHQRAHNLFQSPRADGAADRPLPRLRAHAAADHGRHFRAQQLALPGVQLAERGDLVCALVGLGYAFSQIPLVKRYESQVMTGLMLLPLLLLFVGLLGAMLVIWRKSALPLPKSGALQRLLDQRPARSHCPVNAAQPPAAAGWPRAAGRLHRSASCRTAA